ncbi:hypothetical protein ACFL59_03430 [Planctomycetota bacterium]
MNFGYALNQVRFTKHGDERLGDYVARTFHLLRAYDLFASLLRDFPEYPGADRVLFSMAKCYAHLMDYRPAKGVDVWCYPDGPPTDGRGKLEYGHERVAALFRRVAEEFPLSPLLDDAERAADYRERMARKLRTTRVRRRRSR